MTDSTENLPCETIMLTSMAVNGRRESLIPIFILWSTTVGKIILSNHIHVHVHIQLHPFLNLCDIKVEDIGKPFRLFPLIRQITGSLYSRLIVTIVLSTSRYRRALRPVTVTWVTTFLRELKTFTFNWLNLLLRLCTMGGSVAECRVTVLGKLFTPIVPLFTKQQNW